MYLYVESTYMRLFVSLGIWKYEGAYIYMYTYARRQSPLEREGRRPGTSTLILPESARPEHLKSQNDRLVQVYVYMYVQ